MSTHENVIYNGVNIVYASGLQVTIGYVQSVKGRNYFVLRLVGVNV